MWPLRRRGNGRGRPVGLHGWPNASKRNNRGSQVVDRGRNEIDILVVVVGTDVDGSHSNQSVYNFCVPLPLFYKYRLFN